MGILGKIVGGTIGFALGGPLGAIAGAAFGHAFDLDKERLESGQQARISPGEEAQVTFFVAAFSMMAKIAKADGTVTKEEMDSINRFMLYDLNLDPQNRRIAMDIFHAALGSAQSFQDFAAQFYHHFRYQRQMLELMIDILLRVSLADGILSANEEKLILSAVRTFNFSDEEYRKLKSRYVKDTDKYYAVLGCNRSDPDEQVKRRYRKLVSDYHPDKIASKGLPEEFTKFANDKFREIQEAYDAIKLERNIR